MEKIVKCILISLLITAFFPSTKAFANKIILSFRIDLDSFTLDFVNSGDSKWVMLFKRGTPAIFLISTKEGVLFKNRRWELLPANSISNGRAKFLESSKKGESNSFAFAPLDLKEYISSTISALRPTDFPRLFIKALIKNPGEKAGSFVSTSIHELIINDKRISEVKEISEESVPNEVKSAFEKEIEKIAAEENSSEYGYW